MMICCGSVAKIEKFYKYYVFVGTMRNITYKSNNNANVPQVLHLVDIF